MFHNLNSNTAEPNQCNFLHLSDWSFILLSLICLQIFYFIGFGLFCVETLISIWVIQVWLHLLRFQIILGSFTSHLEWHDFLTVVAMQQVYMYFRGSGKAAEMKREAARGALRAAVWYCKLPCTWIDVVNY